STAREYPCPSDGVEVDWRPALRAVLAARVRGVAPADIARAFHRGLARGIADAAAGLARAHHLDRVVLSGGVVQNELLLTQLRDELSQARLRTLTNALVPPNDGGISLGQAAIAAGSRW